MTKDKNQKAKYWWFVLYPESAPADWYERLSQLAIPCSISPLHEPDPIENNLKPHYHIILEFSNPTTFNYCSKQIEQFNVPIPKPVPSLKGAFEYLTHKNHPEKQQFDSAAECLNGFSYADHIFDDVCNNTFLLLEVLEDIKTYDFKEYWSLLKYYTYVDLEKFSLVSKKSLFFRSALQSRKYSSADEFRKVNKLLDLELDDEINYSSVQLDELQTELNKLDSIYLSSDLASEDERS